MNQTLHRLKSISFSTPRDAFTSELQCFMRAINSHSVSNLTSINSEAWEAETIGNAAKNIMLESKHIIIKTASSGHEKCFVCPSDVHNFVLLMFFFISAGSELQDI